MKPVPMGGSSRVLDGALEGFTGRHHRERDTIPVSALCSLTGIRVCLGVSQSLELCLASAKGPQGILAME